MYFMQFKVEKTRWSRASRRVICAFLATCIYIPMLLLNWVIALHTNNYHTFFIYFRKQNWSFSIFGRFESVHTRRRRWAECSGITSPKIWLNHFKSAIARDLAWQRCFLSECNSQGGIQLQRIGQPYCYRAWPRPTTLGHVKLCPRSASSFKCITFFSFSYLSYTWIPFGNFILHPPGELAFGATDTMFDFDAPNPEDENLYQRKMQTIEKLQSLRYFYWPLWYYSGHDEVLPAAMWLISRCWTGRCLLRCSGADSPLKKLGSNCWIAGFRLLKFQLIIFEINL